MWTLESGIKIARKIELVCIPLGFHCAIGGSVLHKGESKKDLDIFIYPHKRNNGEVVSKLLLGLAVLDVVVTNETTHYHYADSKRVVITRIGEKRIDFFIL